MLPSHFFISGVRELYQQSSLVDKGRFCIKLSVCVPFHHCVVRGEHDRSIRCQSFKKRCVLLVTIRNNKLECFSLPNIFKLVVGKSLPEWSTVIGNQLQAVGTWTRKTWQGQTLQLILPQCVSDEEANQFYNVDTRSQNTSAYSRTVFTKPSF